MSRFVLPAFAFVIGCSGGTFEVAATDAASSETADVDNGDTADTAIPDTCATPNSCGGCAKLDHVAGDMCGVCRTGQWKCDGPNAMVCDDPFTGPLPDTACGTCKTVKLSCGPDGRSAICPTDDANACGGCGTIVNYPGTKCGTCKTLEYKCAVDKSGTFCPGDDHNGCMGCMLLANSPGKVCGVCGGGAYVCNGTEATRCSDPVTTPAPGTVCGICSKSSYQCSTDKASTFCAKPDDRTDNFDAFYTSTSSAIWTLAAAEAVQSQIGVAFTTARLGTITSVTLGLQRYDDNATYPSYGSVRVRLIKGNPTMTPASADVLATTTIGGETVADVPGTVTVPITGAPSLPAGTRVWVHITDASERFNYGLLGGSATGPAHLSPWYIDGSTSTFKEYTGYDPYLRVGMLGCF